MEAVEQNLDAIIGEEFLTWLWFKSDVEPMAFKDDSGAAFNVYMEQRIVVQGGSGQEKETATVTGSLSPLREARFGLATGKKVTRALVRLEKDGMAFQVTLRAEDFSLGSLKTPKIEHEDKDDEPDALLLEKIYLLEECLKMIDNLYRMFLTIRLSPQWPEEVVEIGRWFTLNEQF